MHAATLFPRAAEQEIVSFDLEAPYDGLEYGLSELLYTVMRTKGGESRPPNVTGGHLLMRKH